MSSTLNSYTPRCLELYSPTPKAMLSDTKSNAFRFQKLCFRTLKVMLTAFKSYALDCQELCSALSRAMFHNILKFAFHDFLTESLSCSGRFWFETSLLLWRCPAISCKVSGWTAASGPVFLTRRFAFAVALICSCKVINNCRRLQLKIQKNNCFPKN